MLICSLAVLHQVCLTFSANIVVDCLLFFSLSLLLFPFRHLAFGTVFICLLLFSFCNTQKNCTLIVTSRLCSVFVQNHVEFSVDQSQDKCRNLISLRKKSIRCFFLRLRNTMLVNRCKWLYMIILMAVQKFITQLHIYTQVHRTMSTIGGTKKAEFTVYSEQQEGKSRVFITPKILGDLCQSAWNTRHNKLYENQSKTLRVLFDLLYFGDFGRKQLYIHSWRR